MKKSAQQIMDERNAAFEAQAAADVTYAMPELETAADLVDAFTRRVSR